VSQSPDAPAGPTGSAAPAGPTGTARREVGLAVLLCLVGAFVVLVSAGRAWIELTVLSPLVDDRALPVTGAELSPGVRALGLVGLAGVVAVAATRRTGRVVVGLLLLLVGGAVVVLALDAGSDAFARAQDTVTVQEAGGTVSDASAGTVWPYACAAGGLLLGVAGLLVAVRGRRWAALSQRYEAPASRPAEAPGPERAERALWESLDRGEDPTGRP
jgi:uncharacterized membrane protein (TIGR02234 family)